MIKLIVADMDGTLLNDKNEINEEFWEIHKKLKEKGVIFAVGSGRQYHNLKKRFFSIKDDMLFIAENGTYVVYHDKELYINTISKDDIKEILIIARKIKNCQVILCGKNSAYTEAKEEKFLVEMRKYYSELKQVEKLEEVEDDIMKLAFCDLSGSEENSFNYYKDFDSKFKVVVSGKLWLDIMKADANKGTAVEMVQKKLGISYEETMVFGDYLNDLEMMSTGKYSFAMANAHEILKKNSNYIAQSNNDNGVVKAIKKYVL
ncbi:MAG: HAD family hydrolase [Fusobacterium sp.]|nr:HAD family hydrolase [Fusobacterium sp.]